VVADPDDLWRPSHFRPNQRRRDVYLHSNLGRRRATLYGIVSPVAIDPEMK